MKIVGKSIKPPHIWVGVLLMLGLTLGLFMIVQPSTALAMAPTAFQFDKTPAEALPQARAMGRGRLANRARPLSVLTGTVTAANENAIQVNINFAERKQQKRRRGVDGVDTVTPITLTVDSASLILDKDLNKIVANQLVVGSTVTIFPKQLWGQRAVQLIFAGTPRDLALFAYQGQLVEEKGNTLVLRPREGAQFNVIVDDTTNWIDKGVVGRPAQLHPNLPLHVLGVKSANGDVKAVLITPLGWRR